MTWEQKWMRRIIKGFVWGFVYLGLCAALGLQNSWQLFVLVILCSIVDGVLDQLLPTDEQVQTH